MCSNIYWYAHVSVSVSMHYLGLFPTQWGTERQHAMSMAPVTGMASWDRAASSFTSIPGPCHSPSNWPCHSPCLTRATRLLWLHLFCSVWFSEDTGNPFPVELHALSALLLCLVIPECCLIYTYMNRYSSIYTYMNRYGRIYTDMNRYAQICTDKDPYPII